MEIGGYFELELSQGKPYHQGGLALNAGRNALWHILKQGAYSKIYLPYYSCDSLMEPVKKLRLPFSYYRLDKQLEPIFDWKSLDKDSVFLYINYFGLKGDCAKRLSVVCPNLILDNVQAFFDRPLKGVDTFYSPRKFFGVPDGAYVFCKTKVSADYPQDQSAGRAGHLLKRIDESASAGYAAYQQHEKRFSRMPVKLMSPLTDRILRSIDYKVAAASRIRNFRLLDEKLRGSNLLDIRLNPNDVPMVYPYLTKRKGLREKLQKQQVFTAQYWESVKSIAGTGSFEARLADHLIPLPVDQRYSPEQMEFILSLIK